MDKLYGMLTLLYSRSYIGLGRIASLEAGGRWVFWCILILSCLIWKVGVPIKVALFAWMVAHGELFSNQQLIWVVVVACVESVASKFLTFIYSAQSFGNFRILPCPYMGSSGYRWGGECGARELDWSEVGEWEERLVLATMCLMWLV